MMIGLNDGKIYLKNSREIPVKKIVFKDQYNKMIISLKNEKDSKKLQSINSFDIYFNNTVLLNCSIKDNLDKSKGKFNALYEFKKSLA